MSKKKTNKNDMDKKWLAIGIIFIVAIIVAGTYAWLTYRSNNTSMVLTIGDIDSVSITLSPYQIDASIAPSQSYSGQKYSNVVASNNNVTPKEITLYYDIETITSGLINSNFRYTVLTSLDNSTFVEKATGNFSTASSNSTLTILEDIIPSGVTCYYRVYVWLYSSGNQNSTQNNTFKAELLASISETSLIPNAYNQLKYITFTGAQYIDTGVLTNQEIEIRSEFSTTTASKTFFGARKTTSAGAIIFGYFSTTKAYVGFGGKTTQYAVTLNILDGNKHKVRLSKSIYQIDGTNQTISNRGTLSNYYNIYLGTWNNAGTADDRMYIGNVYSFNIWNNSSLVRSLVPVYSTSANKAGFYDVVNGAFYQSATSTDFVGGIGI